MGLEKVMELLDRLFGKGFSKSNPALVIEYYKAEQIGNVGYKIVEAANDINTFHNTTYRLNTKIEEVACQIGRLADEVAKK